MKTEQPEYVQEPILVTDIQLDLTNVRIGHQSSQAEAIYAMIQDQGTKLANLAKHIAAHGLSPLDALAVIPDGKKYVVAEGNRRITSLKLLNNPDLSVGTEIEKRIRAAAKDAAYVLRRVPCVVFKTRSEADLWIDIKHNTGLAGVGVQRWNTIQNARFRGISSRAVEMLDLVIKGGELSEEEAQEANSIDFPLTNLERLVNTPEFLKRLGFRWENDSYAFTGDEERSLTLATMAVRDILEGKSVTTIKQLEQRIAYADELLIRAGYTPPPASTPEPSPTPTSPVSPPAHHVLAPPAPGPQPESDRKKRTLKKSNLRRTLIRQSFALHIRTPRINEIFIELKRLRVEDYRNAVSVLFRVFLELSLDEYIQRNSVPLPQKTPPPKVFKCSSCNTPNSVPGKPKITATFADKLRAVGTYMEANGIMSKGDLKAVRKAAADRDYLVAPENFNAFVHNSHAIPAEKELKDMWDTLEGFIAKLW